MPGAKWGQVKRHLTPVSAGAGGGCRYSVRCASRCGAVPRRGRSPRADECKEVGLPTAWGRATCTASDLAGDVRSVPNDAPSGAPRCRVQPALQDQARGERGSGRQRALADGVAQQRPQGRGEGAAVRAGQGEGALLRAAQPLHLRRQQRGPGETGVRQQRPAELRLALADYGGGLLNRDALRAALGCAAAAGPGQLVAPPPK
mmetsp:Transcript_64058/g.198358  ORF Transcript_64058/g.198358 Transcript_64058/m.198358 type:complete len:203 (+) Transcript_64058:29-637(+)